jgi:hypothetical protein
MNVFRDEFYSKKDTTHLSEDEIFEVWDEYRDLFNKALRGSLQVMEQLSYNLSRRSHR